MIVHVRRLILVVLVAVLAVQTVTHVVHVAGVSRTERVARPAGIGHAVTGPVRRDVSFRILRALKVFVAAATTPAVRLLGNVLTDSRFAPRDTSTYPPSWNSTHLTI